MKRMKKIAFALTLGGILVACGGTSSSSDLNSSSLNPSSEFSSIIEVPDEDRVLLDKKNPSYVEKMDKLGEFTPTLFDVSTYKIQSEKKVGEGVDYRVYSFQLNNGHKVEMHGIEVDLTKASIRSNLVNGSKAVVSEHINDFEAHNSQKVIAGMNGDFFGATSVNAYVKDNIIVKSGHNDNGNYDYTNAASDIPASMPMLFGVSGSHARIAPIVEDQTVEKTIKSKLSYQLIIEDKDTKEYTTIKESVGFNQSNWTKGPNIVEKPGTTVKVNKDTTFYRVTVTESDSPISQGVVNLVKKSESVSTIRVEEGEFYIIKNEDEAFDLEVGDRVGYAITNEDSKWDYYTTMIGGRQSLVENGKIAPTVKLENTNGAQRTNIPRTCAGILENGHVLLVTCESLRYKSSTPFVDSDPYGVNLPELAEFMRYAGCYDALNFDGGGSTQLVMKTGDNGEGEQKLVVRSSDYGVYDVKKCRPVYNSVLVTTK